jgi:hypothetical protein
LHAQAAIATGLDSEQVENLLLEAVKADYAGGVNAEKTGAVRYGFDV